MHTEKKRLKKENTRKRGHKQGHVREERKCGDK
jgi:hypothetical protein